MVERLLLFVAAASLVAAETELTPNAPLGLLNILPTRPQSPPRNSCLQLSVCQHDTAFKFGLMKILHADLPEQSATACSQLCQRHRPGTQVVMVKLISMGERLVCGCGGEEALRNPTGWSSKAPVCSYQCPDGGELCGGPEAVSVYQLDRDREECVEPRLTYHGCYLGVVGAGAVTLGAWERWPGGCVARCGAPPSSEASLVKMVTMYDGVTRCECWLSEDQLGPSAMTPNMCGWRCPDGADWCGDAGQRMVSVYRADSADDLIPSPTPTSLAIRVILQPLLVFSIFPVLWMP